MGGSVSAAAPDPELERTQIEGYKQQLEIGRASQRMAEQMRPMQREQLQFGIDASKKAYEQTQEDRQYALTKRDAYDKALGGMLNEAEKFDEAARRNELGQQAAADISRAFSGAGEQQRRGMNRMGVNPLSGKAVLSDQNVELEEARARSEASRLVGEAARAEGIGRKKAAVGLLGGYPAMASQLSPTSARLGWGALDAANSGVGGLMSGMTTSAQLAGAAGENAGTMYKHQSDIWSQAQRANQESRSEIYGAVAGAAGSYGGAKYGEWAKGREAAAGGAGTVSYNGGLKY